MVVIRSLLDPAQAGTLKRSLCFKAMGGSSPLKGGAGGGFALRAVLPRLAAAEGALSFLLIEKKQKIKACILSCKNLRKS
jgi:hypothetical protein